MLRLPTFQYHRPGTLKEALTLLGDFEDRGVSAKVIAGGTDLVPNMKHEIETPAHVVSIRDLGMVGVRREGDTLILGAMTPLESVASDELVAEHLPALGDAVGQIAGPQLRVTGTLGGNLCLDTRCLYINQTHFWRSSLGFCLKKDGDVCHVVKKGKRCVAAASNDSALPLMLYGAELVIGSREGERRVLLGDFYSQDGVNNRNIGPGEILIEVRVPLPGPDVRCAFEKLRVRKSIDFPLLNVAVLVEGTERAERLELVVSALGARPKRISLTSKARGAPLDEALVELAATRARAGCKPLTNLATDPQWRREMVPVLVKRALRRALNA